MRVSIEMVHERYGRTNVKEQIQLTKVFIASEKQNNSILAGSILHLHNEFQLGENSLARGIHAITPSFSQTEHNHGMSRPQTHIRQQRMDYITATRKVAYCESNIRLGCAAACRLHRAIDNRVQVAYPQRF